jgi:phenylpyruvate tautomerase PptA (4-oxalocrotonate tautomerase family)
VPLIRIDTRETYTIDERIALGHGVHQALVEIIGIPALDRFQVITAHADDGLIFDAQYLGIPRTPRVVFIQITLSAGRTLEQKRALYAAIVRNLVVDPGVRPEDVFINLVEVAKENWSLGNGIAQYAP